MPDRTRKGPNIVLLAVLLVAAVAIAAIVIGSASGDDDDSTTATAPGTSQTQPVQISGTPLAPYEQSDADPAVGQPAPVVTGKSFTGETVTIGKGPALVVFVAHWCPHCQREVPLLVKWIGGDDRPAGVDVYAVATSTTSQRPNFPPSAWLQKEAWPFPVLADSDTFEAGDAYGLTAFPYFVALDKDGKVVARGTGELEQDQVEALLEKAKG